MIESAEKISERIGTNEDTFLKEEMLQVWVIHHLTRIGEAARAVSPQLRTDNPEVPWSEIVALRNVLVHEYFGLNLAQIWVMATRDVPALNQQITRVLTNFG